MPSTRTLINILKNLFLSFYFRLMIITETTNLNCVRRTHTQTESEQHQKEKEKIDEDLQQLSEGNSPEPNSNEVIIPMLKKNGPLLQSQ